MRPFKFDNIMIPSNDAPVTFSRFFARGDGVTVNFTCTLAIPVSKFERSVEIIGDSVAGPQTIYFDASGNVQGDGSGTLDYKTGALDISFTAAPRADSQIVVKIKNKVHPIYIDGPDIVIRNEGNNTIHISLFTILADTGLLTWLADYTIASGDMQVLGNMAGFLHIAINDLTGSALRVYNIDDRFFSTTQDGTENNTEPNTDVHRTTTDL